MTEGHFNIIIFKVTDIREKYKKVPMNDMDYLMRNIHQSKTSYIDKTGEI